MIIVDNPGVIAAFAAPGGYWPPSTSTPPSCRRGAAGELSRSTGTRARGENSRCSCQQDSPYSEGLPRCNDECHSLACVLRHARVGRCVNRYALRSGQSPPAMRALGGQLVIGHDPLILHFPSLDDAGAELINASAGQGRSNRRSTSAVPAKHCAIPACVPPFVRCGTCSQSLVG